MFQIYLLHQKQFVSECQKFFKFMFFKLLLTRQKFFKFIFSSKCFFQIYFLISVWRAGNFSNFFPSIFCNRQVKLFLYLHILCKNMSFHTQILFRYVYEWFEFFFSNRLWSFLLLPQRQSQMSFSLFYSTFFSGNNKLNLAQNWVDLNWVELFPIAFENNPLADRWFVSGIEIVFHILLFFYWEFCSQH